LPEFSVLFSRVCKSVVLRASEGGLKSTSTSPDAGKAKAILQNVSGVAKAGEILAIMGPSGSGKTTLLDVLAGRVAYQGGEVTLGARPMTKKLTRQVAYVRQEDLFFEDLSVRDQLTYTALLRLPRTWSRPRKDHEVEVVVGRLRLEKCANTPIRRISGGEKKRTNIGTELLTNARVVLLDEPTSGLDSTSAAALVRTLREVAAGGKSVVTAIHQPSSEVFHRAFHRVLLLADGRTVYR